MENKLLEEYRLEFFENPPLAITISYEDEVYQKLMEEALRTREKITPEKLDEELKDIQYDVYIEEENKKFNKFKK